MVKGYTAIASYFVFFMLFTVLVVWQIDVSIMCSLVFSPQAPCDNLLNPSLSARARKHTHTQTTHTQTRTQREVEGEKEKGGVKAKRSSQSPDPRPYNESQLDCTWINAFDIYSALR